LSVGNELAKRNLRREAAARGIATERLIFAPFLPDAAEHLARMKVADLFLDAFPYNAHSTAVDALYAGVPVLTLPGRTFPGRVAASAVRAAGLPELIVDSLGAYEDTALKLTRDASALTELKTKLQGNRESQPLFDTARYTRNLERAYVMMWQRCRDGVP